MSIYVQSNILSFWDN